MDTLSTSTFGLPKRVQAAIKRFTRHNNDSPWTVLKNRPQGMIRRARVQCCARALQAMPCEPFPQPRLVAPRARRVQVSGQPGGVLQVVVLHHVVEEPSVLVWLLVVMVPKPCEASVVLARHPDESVAIIGAEAVQLEAFVNELFKLPTQSQHAGYHPVLL